MTVKHLQQRTPRRHAGLSSASKPVLSIDDVGDAYYETDTNIKYNWHGSGWVDEALSKSVGFGDLTVDAWGLPKMTMPYSLFHGLWTYNIPHSLWVIEENGVEKYHSYTGAESLNGALHITSN